MLQSKILDWQSCVADTQRKVQAPLNRLVGSLAHRALWRDLPSHHERLQLRSLLVVRGLESPSFVLRAKAQELTSWIEFYDTAWPADLACLQSPQVRLAAATACSA